MTGEETQPERQAREAAEKKSRRAPRKAAAKAVAAQPEPPEDEAQAAQLGPLPEGEPGIGPVLATPWPPTVHELWMRVMNQVRSIEKGDFNRDQGFRFRGVDAVVEATGPALRSVGVIVLPHRILGSTAEEYTTSRGTRMVNRTVHVQWRVYGPQGDWFDGESMGEAADAGDKSLTKAQSVAYRVFLLQSLNVPTGEPDPDSQAHERAFDPDGPVERARREWAEKQGQAPAPQTTPKVPQRQAQPQQSRSDRDDGSPATQEQAGEENQAAQADLEEARKQLWATAKGLGWTWKSLAWRFHADHGCDSTESDAKTINAFLAAIVKEAEAEEDAKRLVRDELGGKEVQSDEAQAEKFPESTPGSERLL